MPPSRDADIADDHAGPRPSGGVGGTRRGLKCLHAHYAWYLAGGDDPVGAWVRASAIARGESRGRHERRRRACDERPDRRCDRLWHQQHPPAGRARRRGRRRRGRASGHRDTSNGSRPSPVSVRASMPTARSETRPSTGRSRPSPSTGRCSTTTGSTTVRMTATSAARDAANRDEFFAAAESVVGVVPELLSGDGGGRAVLRRRRRRSRSVRRPLPGRRHRRRLHRVRLRRRHRARHPQSDMGCVRITERLSSTTRLGPRSSAAALSVVELHLDDVVREMPEARGARRLVGSGRRRSLPSQRSNRGWPSTTVTGSTTSCSTKDAVEDVFRPSPPRRLAERLDNPGMEAGRADVIVGGLCVLCAICVSSRFDHCSCPRPTSSTAWFSASADRAAGTASPGAARARCGRRAQGTLGSHAADRPPPDGSRALQSLPRGRRGIRPADARAPRSRVHRRSSTSSTTACGPCTAPLTS